MKEVKYYTDWEKLQYEKNPKTGNWYYTGSDIRDSNGNIIGKKPYFGGADSHIWSVVTMADRVNLKFDTYAKIIFNKDLFYQKPNVEIGS